MAVLIMIHLDPICMMIYISGFFTYLAMVWSHCSRISEGPLCNYRSLMKECPWVEHLTCLPKRGVRYTSLECFCIQPSKSAHIMCTVTPIIAPEFNNWTNNSVQQTLAASKSSSGDTQHFELHHVNVSMVYVACRANHISYTNQWSIAGSFLPQISIALKAVVFSQTPQVCFISHVKCSLKVGCSQ